MFIDVFQDTVCPWCWIGKAHLKQALQQWTGEPITVRYHPYFLDETIPVEGADFRTHMSRKIGGRMPLEQLFEAPTRMGAAAGITFNFEKIQRAPNTLRSHRLVAMSEHKEAMLEAIYTAYFQSGRDIGDLEVLVEIATQQGLGDDIRARLESDEAQSEVLGEVQSARRLGITGVPFFVINNTFGLSGAQPPEVMLQAIEQAVNFPMVR